MKPRISLLIAVAAGLGVQAALAQTWTYDPDANVMPNAVGQPFVSPGYAFGANSTRNLIDLGGGDRVLEFNTGDGQGASVSSGFEIDAPAANWNVNSTDGYSVEWRARLDSTVVTNRSAAGVFAGNPTNWAFTRFHNEFQWAYPNGSTGRLLTAELQSGDGNANGRLKTLGDPYGWHTYRTDVQGSVAKLYVDNYHTPVAVKTLTAGGAHAIWFGDGTGVDNGRWQLDRLSSYQSGVVGAPTRPNPALINHTLLSASYDGITGNGGLDADFARGSRQAVDTGGVVATPARFGEGAMDPITPSGTVNYPAAGNFNVDRGTVEMWVKTDTWNNGEYSGFIDLYKPSATPGNPADCDIRLQKTSSGRLQAVASSADGDGIQTAWILTTTNPVNLDSEWHHLAWSWDEGVNMSYLYLDGNVIADWSQTLPAPGPNPGTTIGLPQIDFLGTLADTIEVGSIQNGSAPFPGVIDELRISDIDLYQGGNFTPQNAPFSLNEWGVDISGVWSSAGEWKGNVAPDGVGVTANFLGAISGPRTITLDSSRTLGVMKFDNTAAYTIDGAGTLTLEVGSTTASAKIDVARGNHVISTGIQFNSNTRISTAAGTSLSLSGDSAALDGLSLTKLGAGSLKMKHVRIDTLDVQQGVVQVLSNGTNSGTSKVKSLTVAAGASLDLTNNGLVIDYTGGTMYTAAVAEVLAGRLTSSSITASKAIGLVENGDLGLTSFRGQSVDSDSLLALFTLKGDTNLDRTVNFDDLLRLAQNYNLGIGATWLRGDSNYDGAVSFDDLLSLAQNYGVTLLASGSVDVDQNLAANFVSDWQLARSMVPEPTTIALFGMLGALSRRRRD